MMTAMIFGPKSAPAKFKQFPKEMALRPSQIRASAAESALMIPDTAITRLIEARVQSGVISAVIGVSVKTLRTRYNHSDECAVQPVAHPAMDRLLLGRAA